MNDDIIGIMLKIAFGGESDVYADQYLKQLEDGEWSFWGTPRRIKHLVGGGKKLILYDSTRRALTAEADILKVRPANVAHKYKWRNFFVPGSVLVYPEEISLNRIRSVVGFEKVGVPGDRPAYRKVTRSQYLALLGELAVSRQKEVRSEEESYEADALSLLESNEGRMRLVSHFRRERNPKLVAAKKHVVLAATGTHECEACTFAFPDKYGALGEGFCEVHHRDGLAKRGLKVTKLSDLAIVCSNCHRMIHRTGDPMLSVEAFAEKWVSASKHESRRKRA